MNDKKKQQEFDNLIYIFVGSMILLAIIGLAFPQ